MALQGARDSRLTIVVGIQEPESGRVVLAQALDLASRLDARIVVAHVEEVPIAAGVGLPAPGLWGPPVIAPAADADVGDDPAGHEKSWVHALGEQVASDLGLVDVPCTYRRGAGDPAHVLAELAAETEAYCIVVGSRGEGLVAAIGRWFRPSVSRSVLREHPTPVLVVPSSAEVPDGAHS